MDRIIFGDCRETLRQLAAEGARVQTCVTSPPYFGLRDYGHAGQLGLEQTPEAYVAAMVDVFRAVRDVLADDGTLWLNIGDSYSSAPPGNKTKGVSAKSGLHGVNGESGAYRDTLAAGHATKRDTSKLAGIKPKDLIGIPWMLAFALRADGWYLRQDIIWHKPNPMPESVRDRCTKAHEYVFLLSKSDRYYFDGKAMQEPAVSLTPAGNRRPTKGVGDGGADDMHRTRGGLHSYAERHRSRRDSFKRDDSKRGEPIVGQAAGTHRPDRAESAYPVDMRNRRSVWTVPTRPYKGAHFATFPPALIEPCIRAGSRPGDVVLDPFMGSGTTAEVAILQGRQYLGCELNADYRGLQDERIALARAAVAAPARRKRVPRGKPVDVIDQPDLFVEPVA